MNLYYGSGNEYDIFNDSISDISMQLNMNSSIDVTTDNSILGEKSVSIDPHDLLITYEQLYNEKIQIEKLLKKAEDVIKLKDAELENSERRLTINLDDNLYLRTENQKLKNQIKLMKQNSVSESFSDASRNDPLCKKMVKEVNNLHEELSDFRKYVYNELFVIKGFCNKATENVHTTTNISETFNDHHMETSFNAPSGNIHHNSSSSDTTFTEILPQNDIDNNITNETESENRNANVQEELPIRPGVKLYSRAHINTTLLISDSTIGNLMAKQLRAHINEVEEDIIVSKHSGATAEEISFYATLPLNRLHPTQVIIFAGSNDISRSYNENRSVNEYEVVDNILKIARNAKIAGVKKIFVSRILPRCWGYQFKNIIIRVNQLLERMCTEEGLIYLDHSDITTRHIGNDGLHLNYYGHVVLKMKILCCFNSFNPYICSFEPLYEKALF